MDSQSHSSSLRCELRIIKAKNIDIKSGVVFVRCYLSAGNSARVRLDSQEIPSKSDLITWNQTFSLDCLGTDQESIKWLKQGTLVFELRWRSTAAPFIGRIQGSKLIGRAELPWINVFDSTNMEIEKWVVMILQKRRVYDDVINSTALQIAMKIQESDKAMERKNVNEGRWDEDCGCTDGGCNSCVDYEFFSIDEAALEAL